MPQAATPYSPLLLSSPTGLRAEINANGSLHRLDCGPLSLGLFVGNELEGGPANLYLRRRANPIEWTALLGPSSPTRFRLESESRLIGTGNWNGIDYSLALVLAREEPVWFWHVRLESSAAEEVDLTYVQDLALASYGAVRLNEFYVAQYLDHTPLQHPQHGVMVATRQNQAADGRFPWCLLGSLREGSSFSTDARQFHGLATRAGEPPVGLRGDLPNRRLQHEHALIAIRDSPLALAPRQAVNAGFFGLHVADHPDATMPSDVQRAAAALVLPEATPVATQTPATAPDVNPATLFSSAPLLESLDLDTAALEKLFPGPWRHEEVDKNGDKLSFFHGADRHVVLRLKELRVLRPHGHILRSGLHTTPDETALTSTVWMSGVFHSMITQGHVSINRFLSTVHTYLGLFRSHGQRVFVEIAGKWQLLHTPSAFEMTPDSCRWLYRHAGGVIQLRSAAAHEPQELRLTLEVLSGAPARFLISHHVALNDDDGSAPGPARWRREGNTIVLTPAPDTDLGRRFPQGRFEIAWQSAAPLEQVGGDELLFLDRGSRQQPFLCLVTAPATAADLTIRASLVTAEVPPPLQAASSRELIPSLTLSLDTPVGALAERLARTADIVPWFAHNAYVHYLSPRGLEQYSGGGWGTRDVCQGPVEMLLALDRPESIRNLLLRVLRQQNPDGDWPQWFMFFERERGIRPGDSHGDIVFWPLVVLAQYLVTSGDRAILDERVRFFDGRGPQVGEEATVWEHAQRALKLIDQRVIPGTALAAYGHGDWNDSLQPADPHLREHMCSAWTVTLHFQTLELLARALRGIGRAEDAAPLEARAQAVLRDFQRLLVVDGVLAGYAIFASDGKLRYLLHPNDAVTGIRYSSLAMIHAILENMLTPAQAHHHLQLIDEHLSAADGVRLFDRPMTYHGGPMRIFQRAESATFFGREIGLMYTHAHLRHAQALAHIGAADRFFHALCQANPIGIRSIVPTATLRQANCYYSSSDAAFDDRYQASEEYERVTRGTIALDGGWRVYSSGAGIALSLIMRRFLGMSCEAAHLRLDPVIPAALDGLRVATTLRGRPLQVHYRIGSQGCGVLEASLNGRRLSLSYADNPYRRGAALAAWPSLLEALHDRQNELLLRLA